MKTRLITAVIGVLAILGLVLLGGYPLTLALFAVSVISFWEYKKMWQHIDVDLFAYPAVGALFVLMMVAHSHSVMRFFSFLLLVFLLLLFSILRIRSDALPSLLYTVFGVFYIGVGFASLLLLRQIHEWLWIPGLSMDAGLFFLLVAFVGTWASDTFAYFVGRKWGKRKMAPHISPNKTIEGLLGGIIGTVVISLLLSLACHYPMGKGIFLGILVAVMAPMGDLFESYMKRYCDIKDSGQILPGHGGMLDRFDSLLFVAPATLVFVMMGTW